MRPLAAVSLAPLLTTSVALAQTPAPEAPLPPLPAASAPDGGTPTEPPEAAPVSTSTAEAATAPEPPPDSAPPPRPLCAPERRMHRGFYMSFGSGIADVGVRGDGPTGSASISGLGSTSSLAIGGSPVPGLAVAFVIRSATRSGSTFVGGPQLTATTTTVVQGQSTQTTSTLEGHASAGLFLLGGQVDWYPVATGGWHVGASLGLGGAGVTDDAANAMAGGSVAASLFGGHQWWLGPSWSLGIAGVIIGAPRLTMTDSNQQDTGYRFMPLSVGIESELLYY